MPIKLFTVPALDPTAGEQEVNQFCAQHWVASIERRRRGATLTRVMLRR
ncbi:MAG: hypothetical protein MUC36_20035 [Planctomycetes bacterium]|jgi:hypothetical protein|nr:hypothetical protein [Planctomycetota bacterium]